MRLHLVSHALCPYVQRVAIALAEKGVPFERSTVDLAAKPDWFLAISPLGRTPVLVVDGTPIFESAVILEYLEDTQPPPLYPGDSLERARHRGWIEFGSAVLKDITGLYNATDPGGFAAKTAALRGKFERLEGELGAGPWFGGVRFGLVDACFGPVFRYLDAFEALGLPSLAADLPKVAAWRAALAGRPSVREAVSPDYRALLHRFLARRPSHLGRLAAEAA